MQNSELGYVIYDYFDSNAEDQVLHNPTGLGDFQLMFWALSPSFIESPTLTPYFVPDSPPDPDPDPVPSNPIPEPSTMLLFGTGLLVMIVYVWRRERLQQS